MKKTLLSRKEDFGFTIFNQETFETSHISHNELEKVISTLPTKLKEETNHNYTAGILKAPVRVYLDLTRKCNLYCRTCVNNSRYSMNHEMSIEEYEKIIDQLAKSEVFELRFTGGEVTTFPGWNILLKKSQEKGLITSMNTNGLFSIKNREHIVDACPAEVSVSVDGGPNVNDFIRGNGTFLRALDTARYLHQNGVRVTVNSVLTRHTNEKDLEMLMSAFEFCADISFFHGRPIGRGYGMKNEMLDFYSLQNVNEVIEKLRSKFSGLAIRTKSPSLTQSAIPSRLTIELGLLSGGSDGFTRFNIFPDGSTFVGGCVPYVNPAKYLSLSAGNVQDHDYSIDSIWHKSEVLWTQRKELSFYQQRCEECPEYKIKCSGFTPEMEEYRKLYGENKFCIK
ncbi:MAG TPA: radical SAM protein [Candidatus Nanoarchaeia archaeon]|nr:radical SAM protein [Candidatus Nanoarchaeia archaeon]